MASLIYFIRHGQTDWNAEGRLQGQADRDLTPLGERQAAGNGRKLLAIVPEAATFDFVASPMLRTRHTMELMRGAMGLDPAGYRTDTRLVELSFGDWQGFTFAELERSSPGLREIRERDKWNYLPPGVKAESYEMLSQRVAGWLAEVATPTICVAHGGVMRSMFMLTGSADQQTASNMDIPQDRILRMQDGRLAWL